MTKPEYPLDRSAAFSALLELSPEFGKADMEAGSQLITEFLESWRASDSKNMFAHAREWLKANPIGQQAGVNAPSTPSVTNQSQRRKPAYGPADEPEPADERDGADLEAGDPPEPVWDPGPAVDDQGGMSEVHPMADEVARAEEDFYRQVEPDAGR